MSNLFTQIRTAAAQQQQVLKHSNQTDPEKYSDAMASKTDANPSQTSEQNNLGLDPSLMSEIVDSLANAKTLPNAISIRMTEEEKEFIDDFILVTLRKERLQGHQVSIAKLMRYALIYLLF